MSIVVLHYQIGELMKHYIQLRKQLQDSKKLSDRGTRIEKQKVIRKKMLDKK